MDRHTFIDPDKQNWKAYPRPAEWNAKAIETAMEIIPYHNITDITQNNRTVLEAIESMFACDCQAVMQVIDAWRALHGDRAELEDVYERAAAIE